MNIALEFMFSWHMWLQGCIYTQPNVFPLLKLLKYYSSYYLFLSLRNIILITSFLSGMGSEKWGARIKMVNVNPLSLLCPLLCKIGSWLRYADNMQEIKQLLNSNSSKKLQSDIVLLFSRCVSLCVTQVPIFMFCFVSNNHCVSFPLEFSKNKIQNLSILTLPMLSVAQKWQAIITGNFSKLSGFMQNLNAVYLYLQTA